MNDASETPLPLFVDLYELTMAEVYLRERMDERGVFSLFIRDLPAERRFLVAAGLADVLDYLERLRFTDADLEYLESLGRFSAELLDWLSAFRFTGDVYAMPEGTPAFANERLLEVEASISQAQLIETFVLNQVTFQTVIASKGIRCVLAAGDRPVIDFGSRRSHGRDAALKAARALYIAGTDSTSNVEAGRRYRIPVSGTMAHSFIQARVDELDAFRAFVESYPETVLLVDTYDTLAGVQHVIDLARELGEDFRVSGVRLDSGDLDSLSRESRRMLDDAGLHHVSIVASGGLDEYTIEHLREAGAPIDSYAVGTRVNVARDAPVLESVYKLVAYADRGRRKLSTGKATLPHRKQVFRRFEDGTATGDTIAVHDEALEGEPLLVPVMKAGQRLDAGRESLNAARERAIREAWRLPERLRGLSTADHPYPVAISDLLRKEFTRSP